MNYLKLYAKNDDDLEGLLSNIKRFSNDKGMQLTLDKGA